MFLQCVEDLEKLDDMRFQVVAVMYVEKRWQNFWHGKKIRTQKFHKGTLVLLYTLKKQNRKLKLRGLGLFVINNMTSARVVRLETLDGEPMANYINGSVMCVS